MKVKTQRELLLKTCSYPKWVPFYFHDIWLWEAMRPYALPRS